MRKTHAQFDDAMEREPQPLTRRRMLAASLKVAGAGALALTVAGGETRRRFAVAQEATPPAGEAAGEIQVGTTEDDAAAGAQVEGEAEAGTEGETEAEREARRAARQAEEAAGGAVGTVPSTGVGAALGSSLGGVMGAIGLATASVAAAIYARRGASQRGSDEV